MAPVCARGVQRCCSGAGKTFLQAPRYMAFDGANIWLVNPDASTVTKLSASDGTLLATINVNGFPSGIVFDGNNMWVSDINNSRVIKYASNGAELGSVIVPGNPQGLSFDGTAIWVANAAGNFVVAIPTSNSANLGSVTVGNNPLRTAFDGAYVGSLSAEATR
jgi:YVTN family beta-propeller protein